MANLNQNRLNVTLSPAAVSSIKEGIAAAIAQLPAITLSDEERSRYRAIDVDNKIFVEDTLIEMAVSGAGIIPPFLSSAIIQTDFTFFEQLDAIESSVNQLARRISDLKRICGSEGYDYALSVYRIYEAANFASILGAKESYEKLKVRFEQSNGGGARPVVQNP